MTMDHLATLAFTHECYVRSGLDHESAILATALSENLTTEATLEAVLLWHGLQASSPRGLKNSSPYLERNGMNLLEQVAARTVLAGRACFSFTEESFASSGWGVEVKNAHRYVDGSMGTERGLKILSSFVSYHAALFKNSNVLLRAQRDPVDNGTHLDILFVYGDMKEAMTTAYRNNANCVYDIEGDGNIWLTKLPPEMSVSVTKEGDIV